jgi:putative DNA primase/helicase
MNYNTDLIRFVQTVAEWTLTGDTSEQVMFIRFGAGANGKSAFLNTLMKLLGDYAIATPTDTFMKRNGEQISSDIAWFRLSLRLKELGLERSRTAEARYWRIGLLSSV